MEELKVCLVTTWNENFSLHCGLAYYSHYLSEALRKFVDVEICQVDPVFTREQFYKVAENCNGDIVHIQHTWQIFHQYSDSFLAILSHRRLPCVITVHGGHFGQFFGKVVRVCLTNRWQGGGPTVPILPHGVTVYERTNKLEAKEKLGITREKVVTQWGFILPHKRYEITLSAIRNREDVCFLIAGSEERDVDYWNRLWSSMQNTQAEIIKTGFLDEIMIPTVFGATDLCVFPYSTGIDSGCLRYALGSKVLCLTSPMPFFQEIYNEYGVPIIQGGNFGDFINQLLDKPCLGNYEARCQKFAEDNSWDNVAKKHLAVYTQVLEEQRK